jgi:hypothetical protein
MASDRIVYCLTRDREMAAALDERLSGAIAFFYNDVARLHQAVSLRPPSMAVIDTGAIRPEFGDAGLGPVVEFLRGRAPTAQLAIRPNAGVEHLVAAEAGEGVELIPHEVDACVEALAVACGCP